MEYRAFVKRLLDAPDLGLAGVLLPLYDTDRLRESLEAAGRLFGHPAVACFLTIGPGRTLEAVAARLDNDGCGGSVSIESKPVAFVADGRLRARDRELRLGPKTLFRLPGWIARQLFDLPAYHPYPLVDAAVLPRLGQGLPPQLAHRQGRPAIAAVEQLETIVCLAAAQVTALGVLGASVVDFLHCLGVVYVVALDEFSSPAETGHIDKALADLHPQGFTHLWWIEDFTFVSAGAYNLVVRHNAGKGRPFFMKRRLRLHEGSRLVDAESQQASPGVDFTRGSVLQLSAWVMALVADRKPGQKAFPYMRQEVVQHFGAGGQLPLRPLLVGGDRAPPGCLLATAKHFPLPPRLLPSWDLLVPRTRVPAGRKPCLVHMQVHLRAWGSDPDIKMFLALEDDKRHVYSLLLDEADRANLYLDNPLHDTMGAGDVVLVVLRRKWRPVDGTIVVEFVLVSFYQPFFLFLDSRLVDASVWASVHPYDASQAPAEPTRMEVPIFTSVATATAAELGLTLDQALPRVMAREGRRARKAVPIVRADRLPGQEAYAFQEWFA
jgi:hypothetical protein